jgi:cytochrome c biogenesis protein CcdA/thiol-disulfide isomerase/thioredoxin
LLAPVASSAEAEEDRVVLYFFWDPECPPCQRAGAFLDNLQQRYPGLEVRGYELWENKRNVDLFVRMCMAQGIILHEAPVIFIGGDYILGYFGDDITGAEIESKVQRCIAEGCADPGREPGGEPSHGPFTLPVLGEVDPAKVSLPLFTLVVAGLDSLNPCTLWVLCFLLSLLVIYAPSKRRVFAVGSVFVVTVAAVYFLFMAAWVSIFLVAGHMDWIRIAVGAMAIVMGLINLKEFFRFGRWVSLTIPKRAKLKLIGGMRKAARQATMAMMIGTVGLAAFASLIEIPCTVGFPMVYTRVLTLQELQVPVYLMYLVAYVVIYVFSLLLLVWIFGRTLSGKKFTERHGRTLKLIGGVLMIILGAVLLMEPGLLAFGG